MSNWTHNGVAITLSSSGRFVAEVSSGKLSATSLAGIKKMIEKKGDFKPFKAMVLGYRGDRAVDVKVVGTKSDGRKYSPRMQWVGETGSTYYEVIPDTPENRAQVNAFLALQKAAYKQIDDLNESVRNAHNAIPMANADKETAK